MSLMGKRQIIASSVGCDVELPAVALRCLAAGVSIGSCGLLSGPSCIGMWDVGFSVPRHAKDGDVARHLSNDGSNGWLRMPLFLSRFIKHRTGLAVLPG